MNRYLLNVSYIGTNFRGVQKRFNKLEPYIDDPNTIQGVLEMALRKLGPKNCIHVVPSSRTDTGVHAIQSTFHIDLQRYDDKTYDLEKITFKLNKYLNLNKFLVRVLSTELVPNDFHCRFHAKFRTYLYRLAIIREQNFAQKNNIFCCPIPIEEKDRCHFFYSPNFNMEKVVETSELFCGLNDFRTFMGKPTKVPTKVTRRTLDIKISKGQPLVLWPEGNSILDRNYSYEYWNFVFKSEGFLYNQVRRIVGALIAIGEDKVTSRDIKFMLQIPSHLSWNPKIVLAPSHGLYLWQVEY